VDCVVFQLTGGGKPEEKRDKIVPHRKKKKRNLGDQREEKKEPYMISFLMKKRATRSIVFVRKREPRRGKLDTRGRSHSKGRGGLPGFAI